MIICPNCGTTNQNSSKYCRKCGSSVSSLSSPPKMKIPIINTTDEKIGRHKQETGKQLEERPRIINNVPKQIENDEVWNPNDIDDESSRFTLKEIPKVSEGNINEIKERNSSSALQEISPQPFSLQKIPTIQPSNQVNIKKDIKTPKGEELTSAMTGAMQALSKNIPIKKKLTRPSQVDVKTQLKNKHDAITPSNLNDILKNISRLDTNIEASAIINPEGIILASALSERVNDSLFASIGKTLSVIGEDVVKALNTGELKSVTINGTHGKFSLAPIVSDILLLILCNPQVKAGIIHIAVGKFKKQFMEYVGLNK